MKGSLEIACQGHNMQEEEIDGTHAKVLEPQDLFRVDHLTVDIGRRAARSGALMVGVQAVKFVITMASTVVLARLLGPNDYGLVGMVVVITGFITLFRSMGLSTATMQQAEINYGQISTLFWINVAAGALITILCVAMAPAVAWFYGEPRLTWITIAFSVTFLIGGLGVQHEALLKRGMRFVELAAIDMISMLGGIAVALVLAWKGARYWALVYNQVVMTFLYVAGAWVTCRWLPGLPVRYAGVRRMLAFGRNFTGYTIVNYFARNADNLLIGRYWGGEQLGLYSKAYQLLLLPLDQINVPIDSVAMPSLSRLLADPKRYRLAYLRILEKVAMLTMPWVAFMMATSDWLVAVVLGQQWHESARIFTLLGIIGLLEPVGSTMGWLFISQGRTKQYFKWGIINSAITVSSIVAGLPWGAVGVAASYSVVGVCIRKPLLIWFVTREGPVRALDVYRTISPSTCAALVVLISLYAFREWTDMKPLLSLAAAAAITAIGAMITFLMSSQGRTGLKDLKNLVPLLFNSGKPAPS
jgi:PST family polysaccharide transporter